MKKLLIVSVLLLAGASAYAQNLNPTVEVTNVYAREATGIEKPAQLLEMPDSVLRFNLDMDYSVNNTPYQGSYEFRPYLVQLRPQQRPNGENKLFVRAGAGYGFHPEATIVWTPLKKEHFRLNVFGDHYSYFGKYRNITVQDKQLLWDKSYRGNGKDARSAVGADALFTWEGGSLAGDLQYRNVLGTDLLGGNLSNHVFQLQARVKSAPGATLSYEAGTRVAHINAPDSFREFHTVSDGAIGTHFGVHQVRLNLFAETVSQSEHLAGNIALAPHYLMNLDRLHMDLGVKLSFLFRSHESFCPHASGVIFPDVRISYDLLQDNLVLYATATGGDQIISYDRLLAANPFVAGFSWHTDNTVTRLDAQIGGRGNLWERFYYNLRAGYKWLENVWAWGIDGALPIMDYVSPIHTMYVMLDAGWKSETLDVGGQLYLGRTPIPDLQGRTLFAPVSPVKAQAHAFYCWGGRIKAGLTLDYRDAMPGPIRIPAYVDLGLQANLQMTRRLGLWLKGGNLLNQTIQRLPFYAEQGIYFTVGASLNL